MDVGCKDCCTIEVLKLGGQLGTCEEEKQGDTLVCLFPKYQQVFSKGKLPPSQDGSYFTEGGRFPQDFLVR
jgi:hypothetical protein